MAMTLITTNTSSDAATSDFTTGIDSTYKLYIFKWHDVNPATDSAILGFQVNATDDPGGDYDQSPITSTCFTAYNNEGDSDARLVYDGGPDQANGTGFQGLDLSMGNDADSSGAGELHLFNPSNTTYVKHFYSRAQGHHSADYAWSTFVAGYINDTTAIDDIQFKMSSGNMDGIISMYGVG